MTREPAPEIIVILPKEALKLQPSDLSRTPGAQFTLKRQLDSVRHRQRRVRLHVQPLQECNYASQLHSNRDWPVNVT